MSWLRFFEKERKANESVPPLAKALPKKALAIIAYDNLDYFSQVLHSVLEQTIDGKTFDVYYDLWIFQDGLQARHEEHRERYEAIKGLAQEAAGVDRFIRQDRNLGTALHFAQIEQTCFDSKDYPFAILLEHDLTLGKGYLQTMERLYERFKDDERIACFSCHSDSYQLSNVEQTEKRYQYRIMGHDWGAGVFKRTWRARLPAMQAYYRLLGQQSFEDRNNLLIHDWMESMGFVQGPTSQDFIKACIDSSLGHLGLAPFINLGTYIGKTGMHWNAELYTKAGYDRTVLFEDEYEQAPALDQPTFENLLRARQASLIADPQHCDAQAFAQKLLEGQLDIAPHHSFANLLSPKASAEDVIAVYKCFLGRFPESRAVIEARVGTDMSRLFHDFLLSNECLTRQEYWPVILQAAKTVLEKRQGNTPPADTPPAQDQDPNMS